jgi:hypothetical protein
MRAIVARTIAPRIAPFADELPRLFQKYKMHKALFIFSGLQHMMTLTTDKT